MLNVAPWSMSFWGKEKDLCGVEQGFGFCFFKLTRGLWVTDFLDVICWVILKCFDRRIFWCHTEAFCLDGGPVARDFVEGKPHTMSIG